MSLPNESGPVETPANSAASGPNVPESNSGAEGVVLADAAGAEATASLRSQKIGIGENDWLKEFYKECGREVTLAYTTLNQMKNWAIAVSAAIAAAVAAIVKAPSTADDAASVVFVGAVLAYLFSLRFFVRAVLCYVNLLKWNELQARILRLKLDCDSRCSKSKAELEDELTTAIDAYYFKWLSPIGRWPLITSTLKLGFGLLLVLPGSLMLWSGIVSWGNCYTRAATVVVVGASIIEFYEFFRTSFLDTPEVRKKRAPDGDLKNRFPSPTGSTTTVVLWVVLLVISWLFAMRCSGHLCLSIS
jgi:hypothetical protein